MKDYERLARKHRRLLQKFAELDKMSDEDREEWFQKARENYERWLREHREQSPPGRGEPS
jgi:hemerythrin